MLVPCHTWIDLEPKFLQPNALNSFLILEGIFGLIWVTMSVMSYYAYYRRRDDMMSHVIGLSASAWIPLILGATFCGWGSFYTAPGALDGSSVRVRTTMTSKSYLINGACLGVPIVLCISTLTPALISQARLNRSLDAYHQWTAQMQEIVMQNSTQSLSHSTLQGFVDGGNEIWNGASDSLGLLGVTYLIWSVWAALFVTLYFFAAGWLNLVIFKQLRKQKALINGMQRAELQQIKDEQAQQAQAHSALRSSQYPMSPTLVNYPHRRPSTPIAEEPSENSLLFSPLSPHLSATPLPHAPNGKMAESQGSAQHEKDFFFPPLDKEAKRRATKRISSHETPMARYKHLRRCFISLFTLYAGILCAATIYLVVTARLGASFYQAILDGPDSLSRLVYTSHLPAAWAGAVFGILTLASIFWRDLDPASAAGRGPRSPTRPMENAMPTSSRKAGFFASSRTPGCQQRTGASTTRVGDVSTARVAPQSLQEWETYESHAEADEVRSSSRGRPLPSPELSSDPSRAGQRRISKTFQSIRPNRGRRATVSSINSSGLSFGLSGTSSMPDMTETAGPARRESVHSIRRKTVYYPTPFGPLPALARLDDRPLAPERSPPLLDSDLLSHASPSSRLSFGDFRGNVDWTQLDGLGFSAPIMPAVGLPKSLRVAKQQRSASMDENSLSGAEGSVSNQSRASSEENARPKPTKTSEWVLRELARMEKERKALGIAPIPRRPSQISMTMLAASASRSSQLGSMPSPIFSPPLGTDTSGSIHRRRPSQSSRLMANSSSSSFNLSHQFSFAAPYVQSSSLGGEADDYYDALVTPLSPRPKRQALGPASPSAASLASSTGMRTPQSTQSRPRTPVGPIAM